MSPAKGINSPDIHRQLSTPRTIYPAFPGLDHDKILRSILPMTEYRRIQDTLARQADMRRLQGQPVSPQNNWGGESGGHSDDDADWDDDDSGRAGNEAEESTRVADSHFDYLDCMVKLAQTSCPLLHTPAVTTAIRQKTRTRSNSSVTTTSTAESADSGFESEISDSSVG